MEIDDILHRIILKGRVAEEDWPVGIEKLWEQHRECYDRCASRLASRYDQGAYTFDEAYRATSILWIDMVARNSSQITSTTCSALPELLLDLHCAFFGGNGVKQGEYETAVKDRMRPIIRRVLVDLSP